MRKAILLFVSVAVSMLLASGMFLVSVQEQAQALASRPPDAVLKQESRVIQDGRRISYCWTTGCSDGLSNYPSAVLVDSGSRLHIRISENERPDRFTLMSSQSPDGDSRRIDTTLRRVERDGKTVAWDAYFRVDRPDRHYYLGAFSEWNPGDAYWEFHVKTRP